MVDFDREQFTKKIEAQLESLPIEKREAFIVRCAMRALPLLTTKENSNFLGKTLDYSKCWETKTEQEKKEQLLETLTAIHSYFLLIFNNHNVDIECDNFYESVNSANIDLANSLASKVRNNALHAALPFLSHPITSIFSISYMGYIFYKARYRPNEVDVEMERDLNLLNIYSANELLLQFSLWSTSQPPEEWQRLLKKFQADVLSLNAGFEVWLDWYDDRLQGKLIDVELLEQWNNVPKEIEAQGVAAINAYLKSLVDKTVTQPLNRVRVIFIGYGEAGKTSLIHALHGEPVEEGKGEMTAGIDIREWLVPDSEITAHFWDFGGQVMAHATHQFFLRSSCLYVLVLNARNEINGTEQAEYWLEHVKSFGKDAPVMIVGNKADQATLSLDMSYLKGKYANIVDFYPLSCTQARGAFQAKFASFKQDFCQQLRKVGTHQMLFTPAQFAVLQTLRDRAAQANFLPQQDFVDLCSEHHISSDGVQNRDWLLDLFDKLGVVIHFPNLPYLDEYVLNPRWLTHGVYTLMYGRQARLTLKDAITVLRDKPLYDEHGKALAYPSDKCRFVLEAMQEFKLCYPLASDRNTLIIPELLPSDSPTDIPFDKTGALAFEFVFRGFLPRHVLPELIVNRHEEIEQHIVWQRGVLLKHKVHAALALLQVDYHERVLSIWVQGRDAKEYLSLLNDEVLKILGRLESLEYKEWITLPFSTCIGDSALLRTKAEEKAPYRQILAFARKCERVYISESGLDYDVEKILGVILAKEHYIAINTQNYIEGNVNDSNIIGRDNFLK